MKKWSSLCLCITALLCLVFFAAPKTQAATEGYYTYEVSDSKATITDVDTSISGDITIPSTLDGYPVTSIGDYAFYYCKSLTSITVPDSVTSIGNRAFYNCTSLTSITVPDSVTSIGNRAFYNCTSLTSITIPDSVTSIGDDAFYYCTSLTSITVPDSVTSIGNYAFNNCTSLMSITLPDSVTSIGDYAFYYCKSLTSITVPDSVTSIGVSVFWGCTSLTSITVPDSVTSIGNYAFNNCTSLMSITLPDGVASIGDSAFHNCTSLTGIWVNSNNPNYSSDDYGVLFNKNKTMLIAAPGAIVSYTIPDSVASIGYSAFYNCKSLTSITLPDSVTSIGGSVFWGCTSLTSITIPDGVASIGGSVFWGCTSLTSITLPDSVTSIGYSAFYKCANLENVYYGGTRLQWLEISIGSNNTCLTEATIHCTCSEHIFTNYVSNNDATCTADGTKTAKCDNCNATDTVADTDSALGHSFTNYISNNDATATQDGTKTAKCDRCDVTDTIVDEGSMLHPGILFQPEPVTVETGSTVRFRVEAQGIVVSYKWQYRKIYKWFDTSMEGFDTDTLTVAATGARNGYDYRCVVTFADGTVLYSEPAELTVNTEIAILSNPNDQVAVLGTKGQFTASAEGEGIKYQWQYCRPGSEKWIDTAMEGTTKATVYIETTAARNGYQYRCKITDVTGKVAYTEVAALSVLTVTEQPTDVVASIGGTAQFTVSTSVEAGFTYQWQYRRSATGSWTNTIMTGYNTATLTVSATKARNGYQYRCILTGAKNGKLTSEAATLSVGEPVTIKTQPESVTVSSADNAVFTVVAENVASWQWYYSKTNGNIWSMTTATGNKTDTLTVAAKGKNGYQYRCKLIGLDGSEVYTDIVTLTLQ